MSVSSSDAVLPTISDFEIVKHVSSGAFGDVFLAKRSGQDNQQSLFAVKRVAKKTLVTKNLIDQIRCERAALATSRCRHVVHLYYSLQTDSHVYLVMEYLCGGDLRSMLLAVGCLNQEAAVVYTAEVATALQYLHSHGIIHRDIKPDNMLVSASGHIKLTDFGLSQVSVKRVTQHQLLYGNSTPGGYQASAEKRYPRTPRQLMSLAADFSFGSAGGGGGSGCCNRRSRGRRQTRLLAARSAATMTTPDEELAATAAADSPSLSTLPPPLPAPCFDESPLPHEDGEAGCNKKSPFEVLTTTSQIHNDSSAEAIVEREIAADTDGVSAEQDHVTRVRFKSGPAAAASVASSSLWTDEFHCDPLSSQRSSGQSTQHQHLLGTPDYLAPELIQGLPHSTPVDYWALGVCLFEFLTGFPPFSGDSPEQVMENILSRQIPWPEAGSAADEDDEQLSEPELSAEAVSAIDGLLCWEPAGRLDIDDLSRHALFAGIDWQRLHSSEAPFVPDLGGDCQDTSYFEPANRARRRNSAAQPRSPLG